MIFLDKGNFFFESVLLAQSSVKTKLVDVQRPKPILTL